MLYSIGWRKIDDRGFFYKRMLRQIELVTKISQASSLGQTGELGFDIEPADDV